MWKSFYMSANLAKIEIIPGTHPVPKEAQHHVFAFLETSSAPTISPETILPLT